MGSTAAEAGAAAGVAAGASAAAGACSCLEVDPFSGST